MKGPVAGRRVVVTGGHGFLGRHVVQALIDAGAGQVLVPTRTEYDLLRGEATARMIADAQPDVIIHLAATVGGIQANRAAPGKFLHDNLRMGLELIEQSRLARVDRVVMVGTVCAYPRDTPVPFREDAIWAGYPEETNAAYGIAKRTLLELGRAYRAQYGMDVIHLLPANLYGPGDHFGPERSHVVPALIRRFCKAAESGRRWVEVWGDGTATRDFLYVADGARGIVAATERYDDDAPLNLGTGVETSVAGLAETICELSGFDGEVRWAPAEPSGQQRRCLDVSRARAEIGFQAEISLQEGLAHTIRWYRDAPGGATSVG